MYSIYTQDCLFNLLPRRFPRPVHGHAPRPRRERDSSSHPCDVCSQSMPSIVCAATSATSVVVDGEARVDAVAEIRFLRPRYHCRRRRRRRNRRRSRLVEDEAEAEAEEVTRLMMMMMLIMMLMMLMMLMVVEKDSYEHESPPH